MEKINYICIMTKEDLRVGDIFEWRSTPDIRFIIHEIDDNCIVWRVFRLEYGVSDDGIELIKGYEINNLISLLNRGHVFRVTWFSGKSIKKHVMV